MKLKDAVIKAQVLSRGRSQGKFQNGFEGGIHIVSKPEEARKIATKMLGEKFITAQAPQGMSCNKVLLMERIFMRREFYVSILMDRDSQGPVLVASPRGGTPIQEVAKAHPELIYTEEIDILEGLQEEQCEGMAKNLGLDEGTDSFNQCVKLMLNLYKMFHSCDCTQIEVNPLAETPEGDIFVCDAKINFDDAAAYRQSSIFEKRDKSQEDPREAMAIEYPAQLDYIGLDGNIGCMVNGGSYYS
jgi:succinyl-CoA synthetase beta subunit